jgi:AraC-like DNA-binding protein
VSLSEVAFLLGFSDQTSFNRAFRRWTGISPGVWRNSATQHPRDALMHTAVASSS